MLLKSLYLELICMFKPKRTYFVSQAIVMNKIAYSLLFSIQSFICSNDLIILVLLLILDVWTIVRFHWQETKNKREHDERCVNMKWLCGGSREETQECLQQRIPHMDTS